MLEIDGQSNLKRQLDAINKWSVSSTGPSASRRPAGIESIDQRMIERTVLQALVKNKQIVLNIVGENYRSIGNLDGRW